ncbi:hypothetical protein NESM_000741100 [Novymonas esmeraldas]|uniref:Uncharacterized protein n=1 Tax=Novymonas esmeraldas TaxID=1808958 RepID=A0AAW0EWG4_9TRYP
MTLRVAAQRGDRRPDNRDGGGRGHSGAGGDTSTRVKRVGGPRTVSSQARRRGRTFREGAGSGDPALLVADAAIARAA